MNLKQLLKFVGLGAIIGQLVGFWIATGFSLLWGGHLWQPSSTQFVSQFESPVVAVVVSALIWAAIGIVFTVSSVWIFEYTTWSIATKSIAHFLITLGLFTPLAIAAGWFPLRWDMLVWFFAEFVVIYAIIATFVSIQQRRITARINRRLAANHNIAESN